MLKTKTASLPKLLVLVAACAASMLAQAQGAPSRIGYVFTERLMTESKLADRSAVRVASITQ